MRRRGPTTAPAPSPSSSPPNSATEPGSRVAGGFGIYVHWPFCVSKCPYCDFNSHVRDRIDQKHWSETLVRELETIAGSLDRRPLVETIFFGGGTPSLMAAETAERVINAAAMLFPFTDDLEITLEANPSSADAGRFRGYRNAGVNRLSLGVQSLEDEALKFLGRRHSAAEAIAAIGLARDVFPRLSFDLIYARPGQTPAAWRTELTAAIALTADHLSLYQLTFEEGTKFTALLRAGIIDPLTDDAYAELYELTGEVTEANGLNAYEISNYAAAGAESRHNLIYWRGGAYLGIGPGAHGRLPHGAEGRMATETERRPEAWAELVGRKGSGETLRLPLSAPDQAKELLLMSLRLAEGADLERITRLAPQLLDLPAIDRLSAEGYLERSAGRLKATPRGRPLLDRLLAEITA